MQIGRMYWVNPKGDRIALIKAILKSYIQKAGSPPQIILHNPEDKIEEIDGFEGTLRGYHAVLPNHLWMGIEEETKKATTVSTTGKQKRK
jgi:hypothetical protein